jgi:2-haloacid dehalogenase
MNSEKKTIVFDFGGVLIDWNPRHLYEKMFHDKNEMEWFLENVCSDKWNLMHDKGAKFSESIPVLQAQYPQYNKEIESYYSRWPEMIGGKIEGSIEILQELQAKGYAVYGLTNWARETFDIVYDEYEFFRKLDGIVVSADEKLLKPDPELFKVLINRYNLKPESCVFIDDNLHNYEAAKEMGFISIRFTSPEDLRVALHKLDIL